MRSIRNKQIQGHPFTTQRRLLLSLMRHTGGHMDARELYQRALSNGASISLATVYRCLHLFKEIGLVDEIWLGQTRCYYEIKQSAQHQHLVCRSCGKVIEFESPLISKLTHKLQREKGFNVTRAELLFEGYCQQCQDKTNYSMKADED
jgi:Fur family ferric uptake transcriptional regulator